jgi:hypothetical protein
MSSAIYLFGPMNREENRLTGSSGCIELSHARRRHPPANAGTFL